MCMLCFCFGPISEKDGLRNWKNAEELLNKHDSSAIHQKSVISAESFLQVVVKGEQSVAALLDEGFTAKQQERLAVLCSILECIIFCDRQGLSLHESSSGNSGNFRSLLELMAQTDTKLKKAS